MMVEISLIARSFYTEKLAALEKAVGWQMPGHQGFYSSNGDIRSSTDLAVNGGGFSHTLQSANPKHMGVKEVLDAGLQLCKFCMGTAAAPRQLQQLLKLMNSTNQILRQIRIPQLAITRACDHPNMLYIISDCVRLSLLTFNYRKKNTKLVVVVR